MCGVDDKGTIVGSGIGYGDVDALQADLTGHISPSAFISFEIHEISGKTLLAIEVPSGKDVPYSFMDDIYVREGEHLRKADVQVIRDMVLRRQSEPERWERRFSDARLDGDLDESQLSSVAEAIRT